MPLTEVKIKNAKSEEKPVRMWDSGGLYLEIAPSGGKWWRWKYRFGGKEKRLSLGVYPDVGLKDARDRRDEARKLLASEVDPGENRKAVKKAKGENAANSFEALAREWLGKYSQRWSEGHCDRLLKSLERDIFPWVGSKPIADVSAPELLATLRRIEDRGALETAHRILSNCGQIFRYAIATGRAERNPASDLKGALPPVKGGHLASTTDPKKVGELLRVLDGYQGTLMVSCALKLAPLLFVRPGELRQMKWGDIDFEVAEWRFIVTKTRTPLIVPLAKQSLVILQELRPLTGADIYVFPSPRAHNKPMSDNAILSALRRCGIPKEEMSGHGFRAMARTILDEVLGVRPDFIEHQLAHAVRDPNGRAYNRTAHLAERKKMMQLWADYLENLKYGHDL
ncbi:MAG: integrase arm-type DNA-binding domain-containing protein [Oligoflexales bacterium]|nr:integrase arm-type DNA-binding domain-containing protein [Oligoflexales bacterium]